MMKRKLPVFLLLAALPGMSTAADTPASPHMFTANLGFTTDYIWRGISQTSHNPAVQGGIDYAHASGLYAGVWGSNVSWIVDSGAVAAGSAGMELDTYFGFRNSFAGDFTYDLGFIRYNYPGSYTPAAGYAKADTDEVYGALGYKWITAKYSYGLGQFLTIPGAQGTNYLELNASVPVGDTGITFGVHAGKQTYKGAAAAANAAGSLTYTDYKLSVSKDFGGYVIGLSYTDTNATLAYTYPAFGGDWGKGTAALSVTRAF
jgi:uncharacterized protein (TIGR02001 family)